MGIIRILWWHVLPDPTAASEVSLTIGTDRSLRGEVLMALIMAGVPAREAGWSEFACWMRTRLSYELLRGY